jgi:hypothetical protein
MHIVLGCRPLHGVLQGYQGMVPNGSPARRTVSEDPPQFEGHSPAPLAEQKVRQPDAGVPSFMCRCGGRARQLLPLMPGQQRVWAGVNIWGCNLLCRALPRVTQHQPALWT